MMLLNFVEQLRNVNRHSASVSHLMYFSSTSHVHKYENKHRKFILKDAGFTSIIKVAMHLLSYVLTRWHYQYNCRFNSEKTMQASKDEIINSGWHKMSMFYAVKI